MSTAFLMGATRGGSFGLMLGGAIIFAISAVQHNVFLGVLSAIFIIVGLFIAVVSFGDTASPVNPVFQDTEDKELVEEWEKLYAERAEIIAQRVHLGVQHAELNRKVVLIEEELIMRCAGESFKLLDGRTLLVGTPGCRLSERMRVS